MLQIRVLKSDNELNLMLPISSFNQAKYKNHILIFIETIKSSLNPTKTSHLKIENKNINLGRRFIKKEICL